MIANSVGIEDLTLLVEQEIHVHASLEDTFAALLEELGPIRLPITCSIVSARNRVAR
jgi:hypothetical protein